MAERLREHNVGVHPDHHERLRSVGEHVDAFHAGHDHRPMERESRGDADRPTPMPKGGEHRRTGRE